MSRSKSGISTLITVLAWLSLLCAFLIGHLAAKTNYVQLLSQHFPNSTFTSAPANGNGPLVFLRHHKDLPEAELLVIAEGQGFGGPLILAVTARETETQGYINKVTLLSDRESPPFIARLAKQNFYRQFNGKEATAEFIIGDDIDGVTGATVSSRGITKAVQNAMHLSAVQRLGLDPGWQAEQWHFELNDGLLLLFVLLVIYSCYAKKNAFNNKLKLIIPLVSLGFIGFYINASLSIGSLGGLLMGYIPDPKQSPIWWIMMISVLGAVFLLGKNIYCGKLCPFSAVQMLLHKITGMKLPVNKTWAKHSRRLIMTLIWFSMMLIFLSHHPAMGSYEPFSMMFSLQGMGVQWYVLPLSLFGALFIPDFWCRLFCPVGFSLNALVRARRQTLNKFSIIKLSKSEVIEVQTAEQYQHNIRRKHG